MILYSVGMDGPHAFPVFRYKGGSDLSEGRGRCGIVEEWKQLKCAINRSNRKKKLYKMQEITVPLALFIQFIM